MTTTTQPALNTGTSIIDFLKSTGQASDFASRLKLATDKGIQNYTGREDQNTQLLSLLKTPAPAPAAPVATPSLPGTPVAPAGAPNALQAPVMGPTSVPGAPVVPSAPAPAPAAPVAPAPAPTTPAIPSAPASAPQPEPAAAPATPAPAPGTPPAPTATQTLQYGMQGPAVSAIQSLLGVQPTGNFLSQTRTAVKAFQAANGLTVDGIVGPETMAALAKTKGPGQSPATTVATGVDTSANANNGNGTQPGTKPEISTGDPAIDSLLGYLNNQSPQKSFTDVYKEIYTSLGLDTMKADYEAQTKEFTDLQNAKNDEKQEINNNPWYSEGVRQKKLEQLDAKYEGKETILTNKLKLLETNIANGRSDAQFIAGQTMDQLQQSEKLDQDVIMKAVDIAEKQAEAEAALKQKESSASGITGEYQDAIRLGLIPASTTLTQFAEQRSPKSYTTNISQSPDRLLTATEAQALGVPFGTTAGQAFGMTPQKPLTESQAKDLTYASRANDANPIIGSLESSISKMNPLTFAGQVKLEANNATSGLVSDTIRQIRQAERNFSTAVLRRESGAAISSSEFATMEKQYFPRPGDDATTLAQKAQNRATAISSIQASYATTPNKATTTPAPASTSKFGYLIPSLTIEGKTAYLPRAQWDAVKGADKDALLAEVKADGYNLLIK